MSRVVATHLLGGGPVSGPGGGEYPPGGGGGGGYPGLPPGGGGGPGGRPIPSEAVEGNIPLAHICGHMDQDDSLVGTRAVHLGGSSHKGHDESRGRSLPPQEEHPISEMVVTAMQQGHSAHHWEAPSPRVRQQA